MTVRELSEEQLEELKWSYFDDILLWEDECLWTCPWEIPNEIIINYYDGVYFVNDDFACTMGE